MRQERKPTGVRPRHSRTCGTRSGRRCNCQPSYEAFVYSVRDGTKIRKSFPTQAAAKGWRADATSAIRRGTLRAPQPTTLREAASAWIDAAEAGEIRSRDRRPYKPSTLRLYRHDLEHYIYPELGGRRLADVGVDDLQALVDRLVAAGLSGSKVRNVLVPLQALYRRHRREVPVDPTDGLELPDPSKPRDRAASPAEAAKLIDALPEDDQALLATAFYAGLRRGELRALRDDDVDLRANLDPRPPQLGREGGRDRAEVRQGHARRPRSGRTAPLPARPSCPHRAPWSRAVLRPDRARPVRTDNRAASRHRGVDAGEDDTDRPARVPTHLRLVDAHGGSAARANRRLRRALLQLHDRPLPTFDRRQRDDDAARLDRLLTGAQTGAQPAQTQ